MGKSGMSGPWHCGYALDLFFVVWGFFLPFSPIISLHVVIVYRRKKSNTSVCLGSTKLSLRKFSLRTVQRYKADFEQRLFVTYFLLNN